MSSFTLYYGTYSRKNSQTTKLGVLVLKCPGPKELNANLFVQSFSTTIWVKAYVDVLAFFFPDNLTRI